MQKKDITVGEEYALFDGYGKFRIQAARDRSMVKRVRVVEKDAERDVERFARGAWRPHTATPRGYVVEILDRATGEPTEAQPHWIDSGRRLVSPWEDFAKTDAAYGKAAEDRRLLVTLSEKRLARIKRALDVHGIAGVDAKRANGWGGPVVGATIDLDSWEKLLGLGGGDDAGGS